MSVQDKRDLLVKAIHQAAFGAIWRSFVKWLKEDQLWLQ
jgi:hypothetical protein